MKEVGRIVAGQGGSSDSDGWHGRCSSLGAAGPAPLVYTQPLAIFLQTDIRTTVALDFCFPNYYHGPVLSLQKLLQFTLLGIWGGSLSSSLTPV